MKQSCEIWNTIHDGHLVDIMGDVPGNIKLKVRIDYLARRLPGKANHIYIHLNGCQRFSYEFYLSKDETIYSDDTKEITKNPPIILNCDDNDGTLHVWCASGLIKTTYDSAILSLESGDALSYERLDKVCIEYWDEWEKEARNNTIKRDS